MTQEHRSKGGRVAQERAREKREQARLTFEEILRRKWEARADDYCEKLLETVDVPTFKAVTDRLYGTPTQKQEIEDVTERSADVQADLAELERLDRELKARKAA